MQSETTGSETWRPTRLPRFARHRMARAVAAALGATALAAALPHPASQEAGAIQVTEVDAGDAKTFSIHDDPGPVAELHYGDAVRAPYLWPVYGPDGIEMTRAFPMEEDRPAESKDHPHHRSLWFAHGDVNGHDFWHGSKTGGRYPRIDLVEQPFTLRMSSADTPSTTTMWSEIWSAGEGEPILRGDVSFSTSMQSKTRVLTYQVKLTALTDVRFGDTKEGTFAMRLRPELRLRGDAAKGKARGADGSEGAKLWGKRNRWVTYYGPVRGPDGKDVTVGVALFDHADNLRHPTWWHARDYGLVGANPFGIHDFEKKPAGTGDFELKKDASIWLRYRILLYSGEPDFEQLEAHARAWSASKRKNPPLAPKGGAAKGDGSDQPGKGDR